MHYSPFVELAYLLAAILFILGVKRMQSPATARGGNGLSALGMLLAILATLFYKDILAPQYLLLGLLIGGLVGGLSAYRVPMTSMPDFVAAFNGSGGLAAALVAGAEMARFIAAGGAADGETFGTMKAVETGLSILIGMLTFSGSFIAFGKLGEHISGNPILFPGIRLLTVIATLGSLAAIGFMVVGTGTIGADPTYLIYGAIALGICALILGVLVVIPIGGADMPVVVSLLNSYTGLAAAITGFVMNNKALIVSGALVGASGFILTRIMCEAMNRSLLNVLLGGFGGTSETAAATGGQVETRPVSETSAEDAAIMMGYASKVVIVPGYGMAVAQAQHVVRELADQLSERGVQVMYAVHPVAGRMPGHMNVLLAEANVPYDQLFELEEINPEFETTDVSLVIGANDVVNPAARHDKASPIYGMPILDVDKSGRVIVLKRSMRPGYAGVENELFYHANTSMLFGDAKESMSKLVAEVKAL